MRWGCWCKHISNYDVSVWLRLPYFSCRMQCWRIKRRVYKTSHSRDTSLAFPPFLSIQEEKSFDVFCMLLAWCHLSHGKYMKVLEELNLHNCFSSTLPRCEQFLSGSEAMHKLVGTTSLSLIRFHQHVHCHRHSSWQFPVAPMEQNKQIPHV